MSDSENEKARAAIDAFLARLDEEMSGCAALGDGELVRHTGRKLLAVLACGTELLLRDGGTALYGAPDKIGAFFDRAAAAYATAIEGLHKRAVLTEAAPAREAVDPMARSIAAWRAPARE
jgi:hypothetical protein